MPRTSLVSPHFLPWGSSGHMMGLDISAGVKQIQQEYTKQSLAQRVEEKIRTQICDKKEATRKVTLSSSKRKIKSQIGIIPQKKQETRVKRKRSKEFYCMFSVSRHATQNS